MYSIEVLATTPQSVLLKGVVRRHGRGDEEETRRMMLPLVATPSLRTAKGVEVFQPWSTIGNVILCTRYRIMK